MRFALLAAAFTFVGSFGALADNDQIVTTTAFAPVQLSTTGENPLLVPVHDGWSFVGCVSSHHECGHHAHEHGFHHHTLRHSHDSCPSHPHLACYGQN